MKKNAVVADAEAIARMARVVHEAMRAWQAANGQAPAPPWSRAPKWMKDSSAESVEWRMANPDASPAAQHGQWVARKKAEGRAGALPKRTLALMVPYRELPDYERRKDALVNAIVDALK